MIYVDSSVVLADLLAERRAPPAGFWDETLITSRLLQYEVWTKINARGFRQSHGQRATAILQRVTMVELSSVVLDRALDPFPVAVRALDALHLASIEYLRGRGTSIELASYDARLIAAARALHVSIFQL